MLPPDCLARYEPLETLGQGGFGLVVRARDTALDRDVAIKVLRAGGEGPEEAQRRARFEREARIAATLKHPNIVPLLDFGNGDETPWLAYEFVPARELRERIEAGPTPVDVAIPLIVPVVEALQAAHERGIIHRDIKAANVLEAHTGEVRVIDFGIARWSGHHSVQTAAGVVLGTPAYLAPEVLQGEEATPASDLYAVGVLIYELVSGRQPFTGTILEICTAHLRQEPPWDDLVRSTATRRIVPVLRSLLEKDPTRRRGEAAALREALLSCGSSGTASPPPTAPGTAPTPRRPRKEPRPPQEGPPAATKAPRTPRPDPGGSPTARIVDPLPAGPRRRPASPAPAGRPIRTADPGRSRVAGGVILGLALFGVGVVGWWSGSPAPPDPGPVAASRSPLPVSPSEKAYENARKELERIQEEAREARETIEFVRIKGISLVTRRTVANFHEVFPHVRFGLLRWTQICRSLDGVEDRYLGALLPDLEISLSQILDDMADFQYNPEFLDRMDQNREDLDLARGALESLGDVRVRDFILAAFEVGSRAITDTLVDRQELDLIAFRKQIRLLEDLRRDGTFPRESYWIERVRLAGARLAKRRHVEKIRSMQVEQTPAGSGDGVTSLEPGDVLVLLRGDELHRWKTPGRVELFLLSGLQLCWRWFALPRPKEDVDAVLQVWHLLQDRLDQRSLSEAGRASRARARVLMSWRLEEWGLDPRVLDRPATAASDPGGAVLSGHTDRSGDPEPAASAPGSPGS